MRAPTPASAVVAAALAVFLIPWSMGETRAAADDDDGPGQRAAGVYALRPQLPGKVPFLWPTFTGGRIPAPGASRWSVDLLHTSTLQYTRGIIVSERPDPSLEDVLEYIEAVHDSTGKSLYYFDGETTRLDLGWAIGMPRGWEIGVELPMIRHSGGWLDGSINTFHEATGLSDAGRDYAPLDAAALVMITQEGDVILTDEDLPGSEIGDLRLSARVPIPGGGPELSMVAAALLELPTGEETTLAGSGNLDAGASFSLEWRRGRMRLTFGLGYSLLGGLGAIPDLPVRNTWTSTLAYEHRLGRSAAFLGQLLYSTSPYAALGQAGLSDPSGTVALGGRFSLGRRWVLDAALVEDPWGHNTDLDVGLLIGLAWRPVPRGGS